MKTTRFERAIFLSWYCSLGDCKFCFMSTQKGKIKQPTKAKRSPSSILAEVLICKKLGWEIEFISVGYGSFDFEELLRYLQAIKKLWGKKLWLNIGYLNEEQIKKLKPLVKGVSVSIETVNWKLRKELCPSKPMEPMIQTLRLCDQYGLKKSITLILGLGEKQTDFQELKKFIAEYKLDQITFYRLKAQKGTIFVGRKELETEDYLYWVRQTKKEFPKMKIVVGSWMDHLQEISSLLKAGADSITKFPSLKWFGTKYAQQIEEECRKAGRKFQGSLTKLPQIDWQKEVEQVGLNEKVLVKTLEYLKLMSKAKNKALLGK
ncbi:MAG: radical SAM protein [Candidatus Woesearchaeota archaeon]